MALPLLVIASGCQNCCLLKDSNSLGLFSGNRDTEFASLLQSADRELDRSNTPTAQRLAILSGEPMPATQIKIASSKQFNDWSANPSATKRTSISYTQTGYAARPPQVTANQPIIRTQSFEYFGGAEDKTTKVQRGAAVARPLFNSENQPIGVTGDESANVKSSFQFPQASQQDALPQATIQQPATLGQLGSGVQGFASPQTGVSNTLNLTGQQAGNVSFPVNYADLDVYVAETQTGRINFGGAFNSDNGIVGQFTIEEKNFDITRWPRNFREILDGTAWRGAGQEFRLELVPGNDVERYLVSFTEPYALGTNYSFSASGYLFQRRFFDWDEKRVGGRFSLGRRLTPDLSISAGLRLERVKIDNERVTTSAQLNENLGRNNLFLGNIGLVRDTRNSNIQPTEGSYLALTFSQAFGDFTYSRGDLDYRRYRLLYERPDGSGRHTISFGTKLGFTGSETPVFENFFAGGFSTLRGFDFRGAVPLDGDVRVGGEFQWLNTVEYTFPLTASDMVKGVLFCDFGTVEQEIEINAENFRVAPGFGFRVSTPGAGLGAPLAFDFAFPVSTAEGDDEKVFTFNLGVLR